MRYRLEVRLTASDVGKRVVLRWRRPAQGGDEVADVLGILEAAGRASFMVRKTSGEVVVIPRERALAGKTVPPAPARPGTRKALGGGDLAVPPRGGPRPGRSAHTAPSRATRGWAARTGQDQRRESASQDLPVGAGRSLSWPEAPRRLRGGRVRPGW
jgi:hypothetical protein